MDNKLSEKEKMLAGKPYKAFVPELIEERTAAKRLVWEFNNLPPDETERGKELIKKLFGKTGENFVIENPFRCDYGYNIHIGENFFANYNCVILDCARVEIGDNVLLAPNVGIYAAGHPVHPLPRKEEYEFAAPISIGDNVWIGGNVVINPGIKIGENSVIGAGSVVTKDIPPNVIAMGNPCRVFREITEEDKLYYFKKMRF